MRETFRRFAEAVSTTAGSPWAFIVAAGLTLAWTCGGLVFGFTDTYQLYANTFTTLVTFLMGFIIQGTQNRDARAVHLKLDEIIKAVPHARNALLGLEHFTDEELKDYDDEFRALTDRIHREKRGQPAVAAAPQPATPGEHA